MSRSASLAHAPTSVVNRDDWPLLRRMFNLPVPAVRQRMDAWKRLAESGSPVSVNEVQEPSFPGAQRGRGIFSPSRVYWQNMLGGEVRLPKFVGHELKGGRVMPGRLQLPRGDLIVKRTVSEFSFDLTELDGICASKSSDRHFESVEDFGRDFCQREGAKEDEAHLARMLGWKELRLISSPGSDHVCMTLWDPRLFVANGGGSHHLAGAVYIARQLGKRVPIKSRLCLSAFNAAAWAQLAEDYRVILQAPHARGWSRHAVAELLGACFVEEIPPVVGEGNLFLIPRRVAAANDVTAVITSRGDVDVSEEFMALVRAQDAALASVCKRWPQLAPELAELTTSRGADAIA